MGRDKRDTAKFPFLNREIEVYRPTAGQGTAMFMAQKLKGTDSILRYFQIIEALVVRKKDWEWLEAQMINGSADVSHYADLMVAAFKHDWPEEDTGDDGEPEPGE